MKYKCNKCQCHNTVEHIQEIVSTKTHYKHFIKFSICDWCTREFISKNQTLENELSAKHAKIDDSLLVIDSVSHGKRILSQKHPRNNYNTETDRFIAIINTIGEFKFKNSIDKYKLVDYVMIRD